MELRFPEATMDLTPAPLLTFVNPQFHRGRNTSVRRGSRWHGVPHASVERHVGQPAITVALTTQLRHFNSLTAADLGDEHDPGCRTLEGLLRVLQQIYPGFQADETVTLVHFVLE